MELGKLYKQSEESKFMSWTPYLANKILHYLNKIYVDKINLEADGPILLHIMQEYPECRDIKAMDINNAVNHLKVNECVDYYPYKKITDKKDESYTFDTVKISDKGRSKIQTNPALFLL